MRIVYLAIAAIAAGATTFSGQRSDGDQMSLLAALLSDRDATSDKLQVGDPGGPPSLVSSR
jgi:hypothetical protein